MSTKTANTNNVKFQGKQSYQAQAESKPILISTFDSKKLKVTEIDINNTRCKSQMIGWVKYNNETFNWQTPTFKISQYGVSDLTEYVTTEKQRLTLKFPLDDQPGCQELKQFFGKIDKKMKDE